MTPPLVLGGSVFGWTVDQRTAFAILDRFAELGGEWIDTAESYTNGESERIIGAWLAASGMRGRMWIASKMGLGNGLSPAQIAASAQASLARLGIEAIDLYYAHADDLTVPQPEVRDAFAALIEAGQVRAIGASNFTPERLEAALAIGTPYMAVQPRYNLMSRQDYEGPLQRLCAEHGLATYPYYTLARGFLTGKYRTPEDLTKSIRGKQVAPILAAKRALLTRMDAVAAKTGATLGQIALAWIAAQPGITAPLASATSAGQLEELMRFRRLALTTDQIARLG